MIEEYLIMVITSLVMLIGVWIASDILYEEKSKRDIKSILMLLIGSLIVGMFNINKEVNQIVLIKISLGLFMVALFCKNKYKIKMSDSLIGSVIIYVSVGIVDLTVGILISIISEVTGVDIMSVMKYGIVINVITTTLVILIIKNLKKKYLKLYKKMQSNEPILVAIILLVFIIIMVISIIAPLRNFKLGIEMLTALVLMIGFFAIGVYIVYERIEKQKELERYAQLPEYSKINEGMLEDYRMSCHENKNHLIIIDNMVPKSNKEVHEYIDSILKQQTMNRYYFINELKNIPITELKGFINFKLMGMLNEKINLQISISKEISRSNKLKRLSIKEKEDLYNIIGVLIDNAYEASKESKEKEVVLQMYKEGSRVVIIIANTYKEEVDIERVSEYGYSTKGKNHGTGLHIVEKIVEKSERIEKETSLMANYFVQTIKIK